MPPTRAVPRSGRSTVERILRQVDLPAPFGPNKPVILPSAAAKLTPPSAVTLPKLLPRPSISIIACGSRPGAVQRQKEGRRRLGREAGRVERVGVCVLEECADDPRHAAD